MRIVRIVVIALFALSLEASIFLDPAASLAKVLFYAAAGLGGCAGFVLIALLLGFLLQRPDDYYDG